MSKSIKETVLSSLFSYIGVALGAFYMIFIIPKLFDEHPENYGSLVFIVNYTGLFLILSSLATPQAVIKFYPLYNRAKREIILSFLFWVNTLGLALCFSVFYILTYKTPIEIITENRVINISWFFYPLLMSMTLFSFFESYCHALLKIAVPAFLTNTFTRLWLFLVLILYYFKIISLSIFIYLYFAQFILSLILLLFFVSKIKKDTFHLKFKFPDNYAEIIKYSLFALPATSAAVLVSKIDIQMIEDLIGKADVAYYSYAIYFMSVLLIPKNALMQTSRSIISRDFQSKTIEEFTPKYLKISSAFLFSTLIIFIGISININELTLILGDKFGSNEVKYAILILGFGRVLEAALISNHAILEYSKYYRMILFFETIALVLLIFLNYILIPVYGIIGAAATSAFVLFFNAMLKSLYVYKKLHLIPIESKQIKIIFSILSLILLYFIPLSKLIILENKTISLLTIIFLRSSLFLIALWSIVKHLKLKELLIDTLLKK